MSAFEGELEALRSRARISDTRVINGRTYHLGRLGDHEVVMVLSGVSITNAAMTAQTLLDHFRVSWILFSGIAGGVNPDLGVGDVVVPRAWAQYQDSLFARETEGGWEVGRRAVAAGNFGMAFPMPVEVARKGGVPDEEERLFWFPVDPRLLDAAQRAAGQASLARCQGDGECLDGEPRVLVGGRGVSGPTRVFNAEYREWVWEALEADALDMESAAVAHVAYTNDVPFIAVRSLSDLAGAAPSDRSFRRFRDLVIDNAAEVVMAVLDAVPSRLD
jgi:adenosylhomocysteine nucleosidase